MIKPIQSTQSNYAKFTLATLAGGALGATSRYFVPTANEAKNLKSGFDTFVSSTAREARGKNRSIIKYGAIGAIITGGLYLISKALNKTTPQQEAFYSKYGSAMEAPDYAYEMIFYND